MQVKENFSAGRFNRRVQLLKPTVVRDPESNEEKLEDAIVYASYPAAKRDQPTGQGEANSANNITGKVRIAWELRFIPNLGIKTDWKIKDVFDGTMYNIVAPPTEIGHRQGYLVLAEIVQ